LLFTPDGTRVVIDGRWSFDPQALDFEPIVACPPQGSLCLSAELSFALGSGRFSAVSGDHLAVGVLEREIEPFRPIPHWLPTDPDAGEPSNVVAWLDEGHLLIVQSYVGMESEPVCRTLDLGTGDFHVPPGGCPRPAFSNLGSIEPSAPGIWMMHSSAEGASAEEIVRYAPERGQEDPPLASVTLQGSSAVSAWVDAGGARLGFTSPCELSSPSAPPCTEPEAMPTKVYEWSPENGTLHLLRDDLPAGSVRDPQHDRFAWMENDALCIGNPGGADARCAPMPASAPCR
jgi:hypothetical protein